MKTLAIKGDKERGNEVIALLEMLGGKNFHNNLANDDEIFYYIDDRNNIESSWTTCDNNNPRYTIFTLEEFLEKYPFKVGDKVVDCYGNPVTIKSMKWSDDFETMVYDFEETEDVLCAEDIETVNDIHTKPSKMKNVLAELLEHIKTTPKEELEREFEELEEWSNVGPTVEEFRTFCECVNRKLKYPKTYKECCDALFIAPYYNLRYHTYEPGFNEYATSNELLSLQDKLNDLGKLLIARNAYWKIAGEQMGLDKPWELKYGEWGYWIEYDINENKIYCQDSRILFNRLLLFPTEEMRDAFYENFKDLIEQCKELL